MKYEVIIYWSEQDQAFIAEVPELPGCMGRRPDEGGRPPQRRADRRRVDRDGSVPRTADPHAARAAQIRMTMTHANLVTMAFTVPVERVALQNAASIASLMLTTEAAIVEIKEKKAPAGAGAGMDDMD